MDTRNEKTPYGTVDAKELRSLRETFNPVKILKAVESLDQIGSRCEFTEGIRNDFLRLHSMTYELLNGKSSLYPTNPGENISELAQDLVDEVSDWLLALRQIEMMLDKVVALTPKRP